jgi:hypothetical protein
MRKGQPLLTFAASLQNLPGTPLEYKIIYPESNRLGAFMWQLGRTFVNTNEKVGNPGLH